MNQLARQLKTGEMSIQELPWPQVGASMLLVRNHHSLISAGTEGLTVKTTRKSLIGKVKERPQHLINSPQLRIQMGRATREKYLHEYTPERN